MDLTFTLNSIPMFLIVVVVVVLVVLVFTIHVVGVVAFLFFIRTKVKYDPKGKAILVTGAASGIGRSVVEELVRKGCFIYATDINFTNLQQLWDDPRFEPQVKIIELDVTKQASVDAVRRVVDADEQSTGRVLYGVVNCAGIAKSPGYPINRIQGVIELDVDSEIRPIIEVNLLGTMRVNHAFFSHLLKSKGCIVNTASVAGRMALSGFGAYGASKFGVVGYSQAMRRELKPYGVRVSCLEPGFIKTEMTRPFFKDNTLSRDYSHSALKNGRGDESLDKQLKDGKLWDSFPEPTIVSDQVVKSLFSDPSPPHVVVDTFGSKLFWIVISSLPPSLSDFFVELLFDRRQKLKGIK